MYETLLRWAFTDAPMFLIICDTVRLERYGESGIPDSVFRSYPDDLPLRMIPSDPRTVKDVSIEDSQLVCCVGFGGAVTPIAIPYWCINAVVIPNSEVHQEPTDTPVKTKPLLSVVD